MPTTILSDRYQCVIVYSAVTIEHYCIFINVCSFQLDGLFDFDFSDALPCFFVVIFNALFLSRVHLPVSPFTDVPYTFVHNCEHFCLTNCQFSLPLTLFAAAFYGVRTSAIKLQLCCVAGWFIAIKPAVLVLSYCSCADALTFVFGETATLADLTFCRVFLVARLLINRCFY